MNLCALARNLQGGQALLVVTHEGYLYKFVIPDGGGECTLDVTHALVRCLDLGECALCFVWITCVGLVPLGTLDGTHKLLPHRATFHATFCNLPRYSS